MRTSWRRARGIGLLIGIITNGLLLTEEVVDRLLPLGLNYVKVTLDGDRDVHNKMRPLRGGQGTFDRIVENVRRVAGKVRVAVGGNFDSESVESFPALLDFLKEQDFGDKLVKVAFKPIIREPKPKNVIPLTVVNANGKPLERHVHDGGRLWRLEHLRHLLVRRRPAVAPSRRDEEARVPDDRWRPHGALRDSQEARLHDRPERVALCLPRVHRRADDGGRPHRERQESWQMSAAEKFERLAAWHNCGDCAFIPVCAGGCSVASHTELGDMNTPTCHKPAFESALVSLAHEAASAN